LKINADSSLDILERIEGGKHQVSKCAGPPVPEPLGCFGSKIRCR
jgi:hypothetical protein